MNELRTAMVSLSRNIGIGGLIILAILLYSDWGKRHRKVTAAVAITMLGFPMGIIIAVALHSILSL